MRTVTNTNQEMKEKAIKNPYTFVVLFDVKNGNPNGDPDADNMPRVDVETSTGLVTNVCLKHKIREQVRFMNEFDPEWNKDAAKNNILMQAGPQLNVYLEEAYDALGIKNDKKISKEEAVLLGKDYMCEHYFDVRTFGGMLNTGDYKCGTITGPVVIHDAESVVPIFPQALKLTRCVRTKEDGKESGPFASKGIVPYGLYMMKGAIDAGMAARTGFDETDLNKLWSAIKNMFVHTASAMRGEMYVRKFVVFKHDSINHNAQHYELFDRVKATVNEGVTVPRNFTDFTITVDTENLPNGISYDVIV